MGPVRPTTSRCIRAIASSPHATLAGGRGWARLLCCFNDQRLKSKCVRGEACPYRHTEQPLGEPPVLEVDFFAFIPCTFAGMRGGCKYHGTRLAARHDWAVPPFACADDGASACEHLPAEGPEYVPSCTGGRWDLEPSEEVGAPGPVAGSLRDEPTALGRPGSSIGATGRAGELDDMEVAVRRCLQGFDDDSDDDFA